MYIYIHIYISIIKNYIILDAHFSDHLIVIHLVLYTSFNQSAFECIICKMNEGTLNIIKCVCVYNTKRCFAELKSITLFQMRI